MKLTPENLDYEDCRPVRTGSAIEVPKPEPEGERGPVASDRDRPRRWPGTAGRGPGAGRRDHARDREQLRAYAATGKPHRAILDGHVVATTDLPPYIVLRSIS